VQARTIIFTESLETPSKKSRDREDITETIGIATPLLENPRNVDPRCAARGILPACFRSPPPLPPPAMQIDVTVDKADVERNPR